MKHNKWVQEVTPPDKFHMTELKDGWRPLCDILNIPVPIEPFPRVNDSDAIKGLEVQIFKQAAVTWLIIIGFAVCFIASVIGRERFLSAS